MVALILVVDACQGFRLGCEFVRHENQTNASYAWGPSDQNGHCTYQVQGLGTSKNMSDRSDRPKILNSLLQGIILIALSV